MSQSSVRMCLVGCGAIGNVHVQAAQTVPDQMHYAAIFDSDSERAAAFADRLALSSRRVDRWENVLSDPEIEAVDLCVPHSRHVALTLDALSAGKHVFLEKPMALSAADCDRMIQAARQRGLQLSVMHNRRFSPVSLRCKAMLDAGDLGDPILLTAHGIEGPNTVGVRSWLAGANEGGVGMAQTVHFAYMVRWLLGPVTDVSCLTSRKGISWMQGEVTAAFLLRFASGAIGQIASTFGQEAGRNEHRITIYGGSGQATFAGNVLDALSARHYGDGEWHREESPSGRGHEFAVPLAGFADAVRGLGAPPVAAEEGRDAVALIEAAYQSAREGVTVSLDSGA